jgi:hypothetical protein
MEKRNCAPVAARVNNRFTNAYKREPFSHVNMFIVGAGVDVNSIINIGVVDRRLY